MFGCGWRHDDKNVNTMSSSRMGAEEVVWTDGKETDVQRWLLMAG